MRALLYGATGLVGSHCLDLLISDPRYDEVHVVSRREPGRADSAKVKLHIADFPTVIRNGGLPSADRVFCALGTTIGQAGSQSAFREVDLTFVVEIARLAREAGASRIAAVSALGANPNSWFFYNRVKGEAEEGLKALGYDATVLLRPSVIVGNRAVSRQGERVAAVLLRSGPRRFRPVDARDIAAAMLREIDGPTGVRIVPSEEIV